MQNSVELNFPEIYFYLLQIVSLFNYRGIKTIRYSMNVWESVLEAKLRQDQWAALGWGFQYNWGYFCSKSAGRKGQKVRGS